MGFGRTADKEILPSDVTAGCRLKILRGGDAKTSIAFSPDGKLLATGAINGEVMLWDASELLK